MEAMLDVPWYCDPAGYVLRGYACGPTSALMVLRHWGIRATVSGIWKRAGVAPDERHDGMDEDELMRALRSYGLRVREVKRGSLATLARALRRGVPPIIYYRRRQHWSVLVGMSATTAYVNDPNPYVGRYRYWIPHTRAAFRRAWSGYAVLAWPESRTR